MSETKPHVNLSRAPRPNDKSTHATCIICEKAYTPHNSQHMICGEKCRAEWLKLEKQISVVRAVEKGEHPTCRYCHKLLFIKSYINKGYCSATCADVGRPLFTHAKGRPKTKFYVYNTEPIECVCYHCNGFVTDTNRVKHKSKIYCSDICKTYSVQQISPSKGMSNHITKAKRDSPNYVTSNRVLQILRRYRIWGRMQPDGSILGQLTVRRPSLPITSRLSSVHDYNKLIEQGYFAWSREFWFDGLYRFSLDIPINSVFGSAVVDEKGWLKVTYLSKRGQSRELTNFCVDGAMQRRNNQQKEYLECYDVEGIPWEDPTKRKWIFRYILADITKQPGRFRRNFYMGE